MSQKIDTDICVIGAGPAGSVAAKRLADLGHRVSIIESIPFPRSHVGICLSNDTYPLLQYLGIDRQVENAAFHQRKFTIVKWSGREPVETPQPGFHVDRGIFDNILLQSAIKSGAQLITARATGLIPLEENEGWIINTENSTEHFSKRPGPKAISTRYIVDATGRRGFIHDKKIKVSPPLVSLSATWSLIQVPECDGCIEAGANSWVWFAQTKSNTALVSLFADPNDIRHRGDRKIETTYHELLHDYSLLRKCSLQKSVSQVKVCDATSRYSSNPVGRSFIRVGDANHSVDPLASQGVHLAILSSLQAAIVANTILKSNNSGVAIEFYKERQREKVSQYRERTSIEYNLAAKNFDTPFWDRRSTIEEPVKSIPKFEVARPDPSQALAISKEIEIKNIPVMQEMFIAAAPALHHPSLNRPIAYLEGFDVIKLLREITPGQTAESVVNNWSSKIPSRPTDEIMSWLWSRKILIPYEF